MVTVFPLGAGGRCGPSAIALFVPIAAPAASTRTASAKGLRSLVRRLTWGITSARSRLLMVQLLRQVAMGVMVCAAPLVLW